MIDASSLLIVGAGALSVPLTLILLSRYRASVGHIMRTRTGTAAEPASWPPVRRETPPPGGVRSEVVDGGIARNVLVVVAAGILVGAGYATLFLVWNDLEFRAGIWAVLAVSFAWPVVLGVWIVAEGDPWWGWGAPAVFLAALWVASTVAGGDLVDGAVLWLSFNLLPTLVMGVLLTRSFRAVGIMVLGFVLAGLAGAQALSGAVAGRWWEPGPFALAAAAGLVLASAAAWAGTVWLGRWYERRGFSDQMLLLGALCFVFCVDYAVRVAVADAAVLVWGLALFLTIASATMAMLRAVHRPNHRLGLLLLRVFAPGPDPHRLLERVARRWRYLGPVRLIGAPDLALTTVEPHRFLSFVTGRLPDSFVRSADTVTSRLSDGPPDPDGRHRVDEFFCFDDTWRSTVRTLLAGSDGVVMDLRGFTEESRGVVEELNLLVEHGVLPRTVLIVDETTDRTAVDTVLGSTTQPPPPSPAAVVDGSPVAAPAVVEAVLDGIGGMRSG